MTNDELITEALFPEDYNEDKERFQDLIDGVMNRYKEAYPTMEDDFLIRLLRDSLEMPKDDLLKKYNISRSHILNKNKKTIKKIKDLISIR